MANLVRRPIEIMQLKVLKPLLYYLCISFCLFLISCDEAPPEKNEGLGTIELEVSGTTAALPHFEKGLLLLHSFEYEDAREEFLKAQEIDPLMTMAYWGEAMTYNHPLWREQDYERGTAALSRYKMAGNQVKRTKLERDFMQSLKLLYQENVPKVERDKNYSRYLRRMTRRYPKNHEVASFYALSLLGSVPQGRDEDIYEKGAVVAQQVLEENPEHPGALHYLIHSYDDPEHAYLAKDAADSYAEVAPEASHALHMPSHIYVALGLWDNVVASNEHSYQASLNRMDQKGLDNDARGYHAYHWLEYGYLQQGRKDEARKMVFEMEKFANEKPSKRGRTHLVFLKGTYLVETEDWEDVISDINVEITDLNIANRSQYNFLEGMKAYHKENKEELDSIINMMRADYQLEALSLVDTSITLCTSQTREQAIPLDIEESKTMTYQLMALSAWMEKDVVNTEKFFVRSYQKEDSLSYSFGPPFIQKPTHELFADWLFENERFDEAIEHYQHALERGPNRVRSMIGIQKCEELMPNL